MDLRPFTSLVAMLCMIGRTLSGILIEAINEGREEIESCCHDAIVLSCSCSCVVGL